MLKLKLQYFPTWCNKLTHLKRPWCWERLKVGGEGDNRGWDGWMASPTQWTWVWVISGSWWWTGRPGMLQFMGSQRVGQDWMTELNWSEGIPIISLVTIRSLCLIVLSSKRSAFGRGWGSTNNMTCYPKWTHKHRSLSKTSMTSEHKCRHTLKRSIRKEKLWPVSQSSLDPLGLGDDRDQRMWWADRGPGRTDIFRAAEVKRTQPHQAKRTESKCAWVIEWMHVGMCLTKWSLCFPKGGVSGSSTASTQWQKQHVTFSNRETDPLASTKGKQAKSPLGHGTLHLPLPLLYPPYLNNFVSGLFLRKMRFLPLIWGNILSKIAVFLNSAFMMSLVECWMVNGWMLSCWEMWFSCAPPFPRSLATLSTNSMQDLSPLALGIEST